MCKLTLVNYMDTVWRIISGTFAVTGRLPKMGDPHLVFEMFQLADGNIKADWTDEFEEEYS